MLSFQELLNRISNFEIAFTNFKKFKYIILFGKNWERNPKRGNKEMEFQL